MANSEGDVALDNAMSQQHKLLSGKLNLSGMRCAACVQLIEFRLRQLPGIAAFKIYPSSHRAEISWDDDAISLKRIIAAITDLGYGALPASQSPDELEQKENKRALWRLFVAGFAMMQVMMYAVPAYLVPVPQIDGDLTPDLDKLLKLASMIITVPVIGFSGSPFFVSAWRDLKNRHIGMDVPVSLGILLSFLASVWATFNSGAVYFDSVIMFVFLLLGVRHIESRVQKRTTSALHILTKLSPATAQRYLSYPASQSSETVDASVVKVDDFLLVAAGEHIPADGLVIDGVSNCDESLMTGESRPVNKSAGCSVLAGSVNIHGALVVQVTQTGGATQLSALIGMMESAALDKPPLVLLADKHASRFLIVILLLAVISGLVWWQIDPSRALWIAISIIVVTCPCALSMATPGVMSAVTGIMAKNGLLMARPKAMQAMAQATHIVFDKTGTLTLGKLQVKDLVTSGDQAQVLNIAFSLACKSTHPVSRAIADKLAQKKSNQIEAITVNITTICEVPGAGIEAEINGCVYRLGSPAFALNLHGQQQDIPTELVGQTLAVLASKEGNLAWFALDDVLRGDAIEAICKLKAKGKKILLMSGDRQDVVDRIARQCGIDQTYAELSPAGKYQMVQALQLQGATVVMVGDGMNDGPVLALADVSVAMGQGAPISQSRSDFLLISNRLLDLEFGMTVATRAYRLIRENLAWAVLYNLIAIPAAMAGWLEPWHAALGMSLSSLIVVANALRLYLLPQPVSMMQEIA